MSADIPQTILDAADDAREALTLLAKQANVSNDPFFDLESPLALPKEQIVVNLFRTLLGTSVTDEPQCNFPEITGDITLLRCLRGRCFDIQDCCRTFRAHIEMREKHGLNEIRMRIVDSVSAATATATATAGTPDPYVFDMTDQVHGSIAQKYVYCIPNAGYTPQGHVIIFTPAGGHDTRALLNEMTADDYFEYLMEEFVRRQLQLEFLSQKHCRLVKMFQIVDCSGIGVWHVSHRAAMTFSKRLKVVLQTWPEGMARVSMINTPWVVHSFWNGFLQYLFPVRSRRKFMMYGVQYRDEILHLIDPTTLSKLLSSSTADSSAGGGEGDNGVMKGTFELSAGSEREVMLPFDGTVRGLRISVVATTRDVEFSCRMYQSTSGGEGSGSGGGDIDNDNGGSNDDSNGETTQPKQNRDNEPRRRGSSLGTSTSGRDLVPPVMISAQNPLVRTMERCEIFNARSGIENESDESKGLLMFKFSNKHSWLRGNTVQYEIALLLEETLHVDEMKDQTTTSENVSVSLKL